MRKSAHRSKSPAHMTTLPVAESELEDSLEAMKKLVREVTPNDVLESIDAAIAAMPSEEIHYSVIVSCHGTSDGRTT